MTLIHIQCFIIPYYILTLSNGQIRLILSPQHKKEDYYIIANITETHICEYVTKNDIIPTGIIFIVVFSPPLHSLVVFKPFALFQNHSFVLCPQE